MAILYDYCGNNGRCNNNIKICLKANSDDNFIIRFNSVYKTQIPENDLVYAEFFSSNSKKSSNSILHHSINIEKELQNSNDNGSRTENHKRQARGKKTLVIILHGFGTREKKLKNYRDLINNILDYNDSISCAFMHLPFHLNRMPPLTKNSIRLYYFFNNTLKFFHQAVCDIRALIDIAVEKLGYYNIILCGFSLGSLLSVISMALDKRISRSILIMGGGNWYEIRFNSILKYLIKGNCTDIEIMDRSSFKTAYDGYQDFLTQIRYDNIISRIDFELPEALFNGLNLNKCFLFDPVSFAHKIEPSKVLMINSRIDHYFSKKSTNMLWDALRRPEIHWLNSIHRSSVLNSKKVLTIIRHFIGEN